MRFSGFVVAVGLAIAGCGTGETAVRTTPTVPPVEGTAAADETGTTAPGTTEPGTRPDAGDATTSSSSGSDDELPVAPLEDGQNGDAPKVQRLSIDDALLTEDALPAPWEFQWRQLDRVGYPAGPNQTDCDEYWEYESLLGGAGGHAMWWVDGGNANHYVVRMPDDVSFLTSLIAIGTIAEACPVVSWGEGGSFTTEMIELEDAIVLRFDDAASGEITWVVLTAFGDLVSVLQIPLWTRADGTTIDLARSDLAELATRMSERLQRAGPAVAPTTTQPPVVVSTTSEPPIVRPPIVEPPAGDDLIIETPIEGLGELLLTADELPDGWRLEDVERYDAGGSDESLVADCPAAVSMDMIDAVLEWEAELTSVDGNQAVQIIGQFDSGDQAMATVRDFALVAACDLGVIIPGALTTGGLADVPGADLAADLTIESSELDGIRLELLVASAGPLVVVVTEEITDASSGSSVDEIAALGLAKIAAAG